MIAYIRRRLAVKRLRASMRPDPDYRERRLAQLSRERRERYWQNVAECQ